jgi:hypothetical protein
VAGVAAGALLPELLEPPEPDEPPMFGQFALFVPLWQGRVDGAAVEPPLEPPLVVGAGELDGSGLAAETTAAAPPTRSNPDSIAVATIRLRPGPVERVSTGSGVAGPAGSVIDAFGVIGATGGGVRGAGNAGWSCHSTIDLLGSCALPGCAIGHQPMGTSGPVGAGILRWWIGRTDRPRPDRPGRA